MTETFVGCRYGGQRRRLTSRRTDLVVTESDVELNSVQTRLCFAKGTSAARVGERLRHSRPCPVFCHGYFFSRKKRSPLELCSIQAAFPRNSKIPIVPGRGQLRAKSGRINARWPVRGITGLA